MARFISNFCPVSRAAAAEMAERLLAAEAEVPLYKMLLLSAAGVMGAAVLITRVAWARARAMHKRTIVALTNNEKTNQAKIEVSTPPRARRITQLLSPCRKRANVVASRRIPAGRTPHIR